MLFLVLFQLAYGPETFSSCIIQKIFSDLVYFTGFPRLPEMSGVRVKPGKVCKQSGIGLAVWQMS